MVQHGFKAVGLLQLVLELRQLLEEGRPAPALVAWHRNDPSLVLRLQQRLEHGDSVLMGLDCQDPHHAIGGIDPLAAFFGQLHRCRWIVGSIQAKLLVPPMHGLQATGPVGCGKALLDYGFRQGPAQAREGSQGTQGYSGVASLNGAGQAQLPS